MISKYKGTIALITVLLTLGFSMAAGAAPRVELWPRWQAHDAGSTILVDHSPWARLLMTYLVITPPEAPNLFRYGAITTEDKEILAGYLATLSAVPVTKLNRAEQKAYWINLYNALTVKTVTDRYPVKSIRDIKAGWFNPGPWDLKLITVDGVELCLNDIEHRILRPIWQDNRIHYAVNCASLGCPSLQPEPYTADNSERLLDRGALDYVNSPRGARFDGDTLVLSSLYDWYEVDFGNSQAERLSYLEALAAPPLAARLKEFRGSVSYDYDWRLNSK